VWEAVRARAESSGVDKPEGLTGLIANMRELAADGSPVDDELRQVIQAKLSEWGIPPKEVGDLEFNVELVPPPPLPPLEYYGLTDPAFQSGLARLAADRPEEAATD
jgi:hypothetical protein